MLIRPKDALLSVTCCVLGGATLLPVLASGTGQDSQAKTNLLALGKAITMYAQDFDEHFPLAYGPNLATNGWRTGTMVRVPQGWEDSKNGQAHKASDALAWVNSVRPYYKTNSVLEATGMPLAKDPSTIGSALEPPAIVGFTFNGLLHSYETAGIAEPGKMVMLWQGRGLVNQRGLSISNPSMNCNGSAPCKYGSAVQGDAIIWGYSENAVPPNSKMLFLTPNLTLSEKTINKSPADPTADAWSDPVQTYKDNSPYWFWECDGPAKAKYPCMFMPDKKAS